MNKVITINLGGTAYQLEEAGFDALRAYLDTASNRLQRNPDREEILSDIERSIGEKFRGLLGNFKNVVTAKEVADVLQEMGPVEDHSPMGEAAESAGAASDDKKADEEFRSTSGPWPGKRLYRITEGAMGSGVCNGLGAYFNIDPTIVRLLFILLTIMWGTGVLVYLVMTIVVPDANTPEKKAQAFGTPFTAQEFIRRAREGYYGAMKSFPDKHARREWKRRFKQEMRGWRASFHQDMAAKSEQWRQEWERRPYYPRHGLTVSLLSALHGAIAIFWICAVVSLAATGTFFGAALPLSMPVWLAIILLIVCLGILTAPLKIARKACYYSMAAPGTWWPMALAFDAIVWIAVVLVLVWLAAHFSPQLRDALHNVPAILREAAQNIRDWWRAVRV